MIVLKHGNTYRDIECPKCGALLSYCKNDIKNHFDGGEYGGEIHSFSRKWIVCPECDKEIELSLMIDGEETIK